MRDSAIVNAGGEGAYGGVRDSASVSARGISRWPLAAASGEVAWDWMRDSAISGARGMADAAFGDVDWVCLRDSAVSSARGISRWPLAAASGEVAWDWMRDSAISGGCGMAGDAPGGRPVRDGPAGGWPVHDGPAGGRPMHRGPASGRSVRCAPGGRPMHRGPAGGRSVQYRGSSGWLWGGPGRNCGFGRSGESGRSGGLGRSDGFESGLSRSDCASRAAQPHKHGKNRCCGADSNSPAEKLRSHRVLFSHSVSWFRAAPPVRESGCANLYSTSAAFPFEKITFKDS